MSSSMPRRSVWIGSLGLAALAVAAWSYQGQHSAAQNPGGTTVAPGAHPAAPAVATVPPTPPDPQAKHHANELSKAFRSAASAIVPTVVTIETTTKPKAVERQGQGNRLNPRFRGGRNPFEGTPFEQFFNEDQLEQFGRQFEQRQPQREGTGSGVIIDPQGIILTNNHVVKDADVVTVRLSDGREFTATDIKTDPQTDMAIVRIDAKDLPAAKLGNSDDLEIGDWVIAVGNPFGLEQTVSAGIISGKGRSIGAAQRATFLQTDAAINPGNSGGPLVNLDGEVIGINTAIASNGGGNDGIGFAVPANMAKWIVPQLLAGGKVERAYLGVGIEPVSNDLAARFGVRAGEGVLVTEVFPNSPAAEAGLREGDVIVDFNGVKVRNPRELQEVVERSTLNTKQRANVIREGKPTIVEVMAKSLPENFGRAAVRPDPRRGDDEPSAKSHAEEGLGIEVADLNSAEAKQLGYDGYQGVLITNVDPDGLAASVGLKEGMLIRKVGQTDVKSAAEFEAAMKTQKVEEGVLLLVRTPQGNRYVVIEKK
jgi:serine protease Do